MDIYSRLAEAYKRLVSFSRLEFNWDSVGANKIEQQSIDNSSQFLNYLVDLFTPSQINPLPSGRVEMRWRGPEYELILEFTRKSRVIYTLHPIREGLCIKQGVLYSMSECFDLLALCFRPGVDKKISSSCDNKACKSQVIDRNHLPY